MLLLQGDQLLAMLGMGVGFNFTDTAYRLVKLSCSPTSVLTASISSPSLVPSRLLRDVFLQGTCDDGVLQLARKLGWEVLWVELECYNRN